jgi:hypothetical protein
LKTKNSTLEIFGRIIKGAGEGKGQEIGDNTGGGLRIRDSVRFSRAEHAMG